VKPLKSKAIGKLLAVNISVVIVLTTGCSSTDTLTWKSVGPTHLLNQNRSFDPNNIFGSISMEVVGQHLLTLPHFSMPVLITSGTVMSMNSNSMVVNANDRKCPFMITGNTKICDHGKIIGNISINSGDPVTILSFYGQMEALSIHKGFAWTDGRNGWIMENGQSCDCGEVKN